MSALRNKEFIKQASLTNAAGGVWYSKPIDIGEFTRLAAFFKWGATTGTIRVQTSCDPKARFDGQAIAPGALSSSAGAAAWFTEAITPPSDPSGGASQTMWHISDLNATFLRFVFTISGATALWDGFLNAKQ